MAEVAAVAAILSVGISYKSAQDTKEDQKEAQAEQDKAREAQKKQADLRKKQQQINKQRQIRQQIAQTRMARAQQEQAGYSSGTVGASNSIGTDTINAITNANLNTGYNNAIGELGTQIGQFNANAQNIMNRNRVNTARLGAIQSGVNLFSSTDNLDNFQSAFTSIGNQF